MLPDRLPQAEGRTKGRGGGGWPGTRAWSHNLDLAIAIPRSISNAARHGKLYLDESFLSPALHLNNVRNATCNHASQMQTRHLHQLSMIGRGMPCSYSAVKQVHMLN